LAVLGTRSTLFAFTIVTQSVAVRGRYSTEKGTAKWRVILPTFLVVAGSVLIAWPFYYRAHYGIIIAGACVFILGTLSFYNTPRVYKPEGFTVPLNPIVPCLGTLANIFLIGALTLQLLSSVSGSLLQAVGRQCVSARIPEDSASIHACFGR
jgi:hypothetical protein